MTQNNMKICNSSRIGGGGVVGGGIGSSISS